MKSSIIGISLVIISALVYAVQTAIIKGLGGGVSIPMIVFVQSIVCLALIMPVMFAQGRRQAIRLMKTQNIKIQILRTLFSLGISYFLFSAVKFIPLIDAVLLTNTAPLMIPFLGWLFMSQKINHRLWLPLLIGFAGIAFVLKPDGQVFQASALLAIGAAVCMAASIMSLRQAAKTDASLTNVFYYFLFSVPISAVVAAIFWSAINLHQLWILSGIGVLFFIVQVTLTYSAKWVSAQTVGSLYLLNIVFAALISWIAWDFTLTFSMISGIILTIAGAALTIQAQTSPKYKPIGTSV